MVTFWQTRSKTACVWVFVFVCYANTHFLSYLHLINWQICSHNLTAGWYLCFMQQPLFVCVPVYVCTCSLFSCKRVCVCVCTCLYGEISGSNLGRARVNSGTKERERERDEYRSERTRGRKGSVGRRREEKIRKSKSAIRLVVSV